MAGTPEAQLKAADIAIQMSIKWNEKTVIPVLKGHIGNAAWHGMQYFKDNFETLVMAPLVLGGRGWKSVESSPSWKWINSSTGLGQLGLTDANTPLKLLFYMLKSFEVNITGKPGVGKRGKLKLRMTMKLFNVTEMRKRTLHPAAGQGNLDPNRSWFDWVWKGKAISEPAKFVRTGQKNKSPRSYAIAGSDAGLMNTKSGGGFWSVPPRYRLDFEKLLKQNENTIIRTMNDAIVTGMNRYLRS